MGVLPAVLHRLPQQPLMSEERAALGTRQEICVSTVDVIGSTQLLQEEDDS